MIRLLIILSLVITSCNAQRISKRVLTNNVVNFKTNSEIGVVNYKLQRSLFASNWMWITVTTITPKRLPDSNFYSYSLPSARFTYYYRIVALMSDRKTYVAIPAYIKVTK